MHERLGYGTFGDVGLEALKRAGYPVTLRSEPMLRTLKHLHEGENLLLIPFSRTPHRENNYTWIAPVLRLPRAFFSFSEPVQTMEQARGRCKRIGVGIGTVQEEILRANGFRADQMLSLKLGDKPIKMLELNRIDAWFTTVPEGNFAWPRRNKKPLRMSPELTSTDMYMACSKRCDAPMVQALRAAIEAMRAEGVISSIQERYHSFDGK